MLLKSHSQTAKQPNSQKRQTDGEQGQTYVDVCREQAGERLERERECAALKGRAVGRFKSAAACAHFQLVSLRCLSRSCCCCCRFQLQQQTRKSERRAADRTAEQTVRAAAIEADLQFLVFCVPSKRCVYAMCAKEHKEQQTDAICPLSAAHILISEFSRFQPLQLCCN